MPLSPDVSRAGGLLARVLTSVLMMPLMLGAIYLGGAVFDVLIVAMAAVLVWEWHGLLARGARELYGVAVCGTTAVLAVSLLDARLAVGFVAVSVLILVMTAGRRRGDCFLLGMGPLYIGLPCLALLVLRAEFGFAATAWVFAMIWATDIGAYAFGRGIGGPKLAPRISPNKTWAGLLGGMLCSAIVGVVGMALPCFGSGISGWVPLAGLGAFLAVVAQAGDLFESAVKRRVWAKDSSRLIPGHGGVLDRVDGLLTAAPVALVALTVLGATG